MQLCESCGACRENEWRLCPFCRASLTTVDTSVSSDGERFDALAAAAETSELEVLPSLIAEEDEAEPDTDLITAQDLAHLTGDGGPAVNGWDSKTPPPPPAPVETNDGIDAPVSKAVVIPLVMAALAAVTFVAFSILTASPPVRPDAVALIDEPTTTIAPTPTTEPETLEPGLVGVDLAEQAAWLCAGEQFSIARAEAPSLATYNDILVATRDGREDWTAPADHETLVTPVPPLIGCLTTSDGGEIDRCPSSGPIISRRSVNWTYRVLQSSNGANLGQDEGTASDVRPCEELEAEAGDSDLASWSMLPQDRLNLVAAAYAGAPHPQAACPTSLEDDRIVAEPISFEEGASIHAMHDGVVDTDVALPMGWSASDERPVQVVLCIEDLNDTTAQARPSSDSQTTTPAEPTCGTTLRVHAMHRDGRVIGSWDYLSTTCPEAGETTTPPDTWWVSIVGPSLGYEFEEAGTEEAETEGS